MLSLIEQNRDQLVELCRRFHVRRLELFGSAALRDRFDPDRSDLDFLVVFDAAPPRDSADRYFGLLAALEDLFGRHIDLVELEAIRNPYFREGIQRSRTPLYAA